MRFISFFNRAIEFLFYALFFFVPLIFLPVNYELFEFNKMVLTYIFTTLIGTFWIVKMITSQRFYIQKTPLDTPILLFLGSQIIATILSIDIHTSVWGYYSRFNGGLASMLSYIFLYYAFVSNVSDFSGIFSKSYTAKGFRFAAATALFLLGITCIFIYMGQLVSFFSSPFGIVVILAILLCSFFLFLTSFSTSPIRNMLLCMLTSGIFVSLYGVLEHFGIDKDYWVQDVQNRVFSTLGQPNWLAAYLSVLIPIAIALGFKKLLPDKQKSKNSVLVSMFFLLITALLYIALLYTKSRSGFLGLWAGITVAILLYIWQRRKLKQKSLSTKQYFISTLALIVGITCITGTPFEQLNKLTLPGLVKQKQTVASKAPQGTALETGGTESGEIRKIVWKGALNIAKAYPLFGTGVETFAYSYYRFRPVEHNMTSEWDFLYNKAHNEYLNYLATTGFIGLGTYLFMIGGFLWITLRTLLRSKTLAQDQPTFFVILALLAGYVSILVSNFFGFSVVIINLYFFLIPALTCTFLGLLDTKQIYALPFVKKQPIKENASLSMKQKISLVAVVLASYFFLRFFYNMWDADRNYVTGRNYTNAGELSFAYPYLIAAIQKRPGEPQFSETLSLNIAELALSATEQKESTLAGQLVEEAIQQSDYTITKSPNNPNYWRSRIRMFYTLAQLDPKYNRDAIASAKRATELAPTDPKVAYNYGLLLGQAGSVDEGIKEFEKTIKLKPDYRDPIYALGLFYYEKATEDKNVLNRDYLNKAIAQMQQVLKLFPNDSEAKAKLQEWQTI